MRRTYNLPKALAGAGLLSTNSNRNGDHASLYHDGLIFPTAADFTPYSCGSFSLCLTEYSGKLCLLQRFNTPLSVRNMARTQVTMIQNNSQPVTNWPPDA